MPISKHLYTFDDFLFEELKTVIFVLSTELQEVLLDIDDPIATQLLSDSNASKDIETKITLIDVVDGDYSKWSFVTSTKVIQWMDEKGIELKRGNIKYYKQNLQKYKTESRIGRIINKLYPDKFKPTDIEKLVNEYKMYFQTKFELIDIVKGKDINKWYDGNKYYNNGQGTELSSSCMSSPSKCDYMDLYAINDDRVSMIILYSDEDKTKIDARSILWKPDKIDGKENKSGELYMDRIYYNNQEHKNLLQKYAKNNNWYYKRDNSSSMSAEIVKPDGTNAQVNFELKNIKIPKHKQFPYADTMGVLNLETNDLSNDENLDKAGWLSSTGGKLDGAVWVDRYNRFIHATDIVVAIGKNGNENVLKDDATVIPLYNKWYTNDYVESKEMIKVRRPQDGDNGKEYDIFKDDSEYSDTHDEVYWKGDLVDSEFLGSFIPKFNAKYVANMDTYMPKDHLNSVVVGFDKYRSEWNYSNPFYEWYHIDDPREPYFEYKGRYYLNDLKDEHPEYFQEKKQKEDETYEKD